MDWKDKTYSLYWLRDKAELIDSASAMDFLRRIGVIPWDIEFARRNANPKTAMDPHNINAKYLAEFAYEWDMDGPSAPDEFVDAVGAECLGTRENEVISETMAGLTE